MSITTIASNPVTVPATALSGGPPAWRPSAALLDLLDEAGVSVAQRCRFLNIRELNVWVKFACNKTAKREIERLRDAYAAATIKDKLDWFA